jgi:Domain of unknown function (DUF4190)
MTQPNDPYYGQQPEGPQSGAPYSGPPQSGQPYSGPPQSGQPYSGPPSSGQPYSGQPYTGAQYGDPYSGGYGSPHGMQAGQPYGAAQPYTGPQPGMPYPQPGYAPPRGTNQNAILALVLALVLAPLGIYFGNKAKKEIAVTGEDGEGLATAGQVIGWIGTGLLGLSLVLVCGGFLLSACAVASVGVAGS